MRPLMSGRRSLIASNHKGCNTGCRVGTIQGEKRMPVVAAAIMPHGWDLIPELSDDADGAMRTRAAMDHTGRVFREAGVEALVLAGPHGIRVDGAICIANVARAAGSITRGDRSVDLNVPCDRPLIASIGAAATGRKMPVAMAGYAGNRADQSVSPLDWGGMVPLWFLGNGARHEQGGGSVLAPAPTVESVPPVVLITPSRLLPRSQMVEFGRAVGEVCAVDPRRIGFVASCDWSHVHRADGPYGYDPIAREMDRTIVKAIEADDLPRLIELPQEDVERAAIDGLWQVLMLAGLREFAPLSGGKVLSYEAPTYFGMIVATFGA
jgi:aromatic ring-opening dioxygenase LigB subunit